MNNNKDNLIWKFGKKNSMKFIAGLNFSFKNLMSSLKKFTSFKSNSRQWAPKNNGMNSEPGTHNSSTNLIKSDKKLSMF